jgi:hypothetical protein
MPCSFDNCPGNALWQPVLGLQASPKSPVVVARFAKLALCEMHKDMAKLADYISPASWDRIVRFMAECGKPVPLRRLTTLQFDLIASAEAPSPTSETALPF